MKKPSYISMLDKERGFGFIQPPNNGDAHYFRISDCEGWQPLGGDFVEYELVPGEKGGQRAVRVRIVKEAPEVRRFWALSWYEKDSPALKKVREDLCKSILEMEKCVSWYGEKDPIVDDARCKLLELPFVTGELVDLCVAKGFRQQECLKKIEMLVKRGGPHSKEVGLARAAFLEELPHLEYTVGKCIESTARLYLRGRENREKSSVRGGSVDHRIEAQPAANKWTLLIDETGGSFDRDRYSPEKREAGTQGRIVSVLVPDTVLLKTLEKNTHFVDLSVTDRDRIVQHLLDSQVGIFGVSVDDLPETRGNRWVDGVAHVIGWVLRLMPVDGPTAVRVLVEQRGKYSARESDWNAMCRVLLSNLSETHPERYGQIQASIQVVGKTDSPYLAYADAIAHTWGSKSLDAKTRLKQSGLRGNCLHEGDGPQLREAWDLLQRGSHLDAEKWRSLVKNLNPSEPNGIASILLDQVAQSCRKTPELWRRYFDATQTHLESKAVDLVGLGKEVKWLSACKPESALIPLKLELAWRIAELEEMNHRGGVDERIVDRLKELGDALYSEFPQLVCQADLICSVLATNRFEFEEAEQALSKWENKEMAIAGRRHWGRLQSSFGQLESFKGNFNQAEEYFSNAINVFSEMTDPLDAKMEIAQTATYRAIAAMDNPDCEVEIIRQHVEGVVSLTPEGIQKLAANSDDNSKYAHHLLVRYLVLHGQPDEVNVYLAEKGNWSEGYGHPWPLIQAYRGILLHASEPDHAVSLMINGYEMACLPDLGPTMQLIGFTIGCVAMGWGCEPLFEKEELLSLQENLPAAKSRIHCLVEALESPPDEPDQLLRDILPFNFR